MQEVKINGFEDGALQVSLSGDIDLGNAEIFYQTVMDAYKAQQGNVVFDCAALNFIDSTTLGTFVKILKSVKMDGFKMKLVNLQSKIKKLFVICALDTIMEIA